MSDFGALPLVHGPQGSEVNDALAEWAGRRIPHVGSGAAFGPSWCVGVRRGTDLAAAVVFHDWQPEARTVQLSCAAVSPRWATRHVVGAILGVAFERLGCHVVWTATPADNERAVRFNLGIGFVAEASLRHRFGPGRPAVVCSMTEPEWRARYGGQ